MATKVTRGEEVQDFKGFGIWMLIASSVCGAIAGGLFALLSQLPISQSSEPVWAFGAISTLLSIWGCMLILRSKGRSELLGALGILGPIGWLLVAFIPTRFKTPPTPTYYRIPSR